MEVKAGHKLSKVGVIPDDWRVARMESAAQIIDPQPDHRTPPETLAGEPYIGISDFLNDSAVNWEASRKIISRAVDRQQSRFQIRDGDIIFGKIGTIGLPKFAPVFSFRYALSANVLLLQPRIEPYYLMSWLRSDTFQRAVSSELHSTSQAAFGINKMRRMLIALPPPKEQRAIAEALSDVDALLGGLDRLIAKKRDLKQATMQQLLSGQTRLPGFGRKLRFTDTEIGRIPDDWIVVEVKEVARDHRQGYYTTNPYFNDGVRLVRITDLMNPRLDYTTMPTLRITQSDHDLYRIRRGDFLFARSGAIGRYGIVYDEIDAIFGSYIIRFTFDSTRLANEFFGYLYQTRTVWRQLRAITQGSSNININASNIKSIKIPLPSLAEQTAITEVLSDLDAEIAALEQRREKTRALKQAMMQELLTGKTRLI